MRNLFVTIDYVWAIRRQQSTMQTKKSWTTTRQRWTRSVSASFSGCCCSCAAWRMQATPWKSFACRLCCLLPNATWIWHRRTRAFSMQSRFWVWIECHCAPQMTSWLYFVDGLRDDVWRLHLGLDFRLYGPAKYSDLRFIIQRVIRNSRWLEPNIRASFVFQVFKRSRVILRFFSASLTILPALTSLSFCFL